MQRIATLLVALSIFLSGPILSPTPAERMEIRLMLQQWRFSEDGIKKSFVRDLVDKQRDLDEVLEYILKQPLGDALTQERRASWLASLDHHIDQLLRLADSCASYREHDFYDQFKNVSVFVYNDIFAESTSLDGAIVDRIQQARDHLGVTLPRLTM
jgi:hypothetical protein